MLRFLLLAIICSLSLGFTPTPFLSKRPSSPPSTILFEKTEAKILLKGPELPRESDGLVHVPAVPALGGFLAFFLATGYKIRENRINTAEKREKASADLLEAVKARNEMERAKRN
ncbi:hypothetical protein TrVE_jg5039 [Triparma verrucosa]|uniref:Uncharacterized protein n=2 Tax=Triparma TaxID=722752 RepID=A0A9W7EYM5_9STRA|nr:hypothetical protein TrVE_jg5039 [Triparma verrucosa]GMH96618.1 hypothetical protein TrST_g9374 [Triparma strigata]